MCALRGRRRPAVRCALGAFLLAATASAPARAQSPDRGIDVGGAVTWLNLGVYDETATGIGLRLGYRFADLASLDGEVNGFFDDDGITGRKVQALGGIKVGRAARSFGLFAKLRTGATRFGHDFLRPRTVCIAIFPTPRECLAGRTALTVDYGGVVEFYPVSAAILRVDIGTTYLWYGAQRGDADRERVGNFQFAIGVARRF